MSVPFHTTRRVEFADTDMAGIVHFTAFFRWMEAAEHALLRDRGLSVFMPWEGLQITFPRVGASCDFLKPVRFEDVLDVSVTVAKLGRSSITYAVEFSLKGEAVARGQLSTVCCRVRKDHGFESLEIPAELRSKLLGV